MQDETHLQAYQRATSRLRELERDVEERLQAVAGEPTSTNAREIAFLEGLRADRDACFADARRLELQLFNSIVSRLGSATDSVK